MQSLKMHFLSSSASLLHLHFCFLLEMPSHPLFAYQIFIHFSSLSSCPNLLCKIFLPTLVHDGLLVNPATFIVHCTTHLLPTSLYDTLIDVYH